MRFLVGYFGSSLIAAAIAATWVALIGGDQTILRSFGVPDFLGAVSPGLAVMVRHVLEFQAAQSVSVAGLFDTLAALPLFLILDLPGLILFAAMNAGWHGERVWDGVKPLWGAVIFATLATIIVLGSQKYGLPPFAMLKVQFAGIALASAVAGALIGIGRLIKDAIAEHA
jgi:hypothetical protein